MDTILASIRRILNEDEVAPAESAPERRPDRASVPDVGDEKARAPDDVLVLGESMMVPAEKAEKIEPEMAAPQPAAAIPADPVPDKDKASIEGLVAARTRAAASLSFEALQEALRREQEPPPPPRISSPKLLRTGGPTLEDLVREEIRDLLSSWLDENLPGMVEALVRSEIEKLTRRTV